MAKWIYTRTNKSKSTIKPDPKDMRKKAYGDKLHNESSKKKHYGEKFRTKKADNRLTKEELQKKKRLKTQGRKKIAAEAAIQSKVRSVASSQNKDDSTAYDAIDLGYGATSIVVNKIKQAVYSKFHKRHNEKIDNENKKKTMQKEMQRKKNQKKSRETAKEANQVRKKAIEKVEDIVGKIGEFFANAIKEHPIITIIVLLILLLIALLSGIFTSCGAIGGGTQTITVATTFTAKDEDIKGVEADYKNLEKGVREKIDNIPNDYPGYDEYQYELDEIGHNPYELAALLTVLYENYTREEVQDKLKELCKKQYKITTHEIVETRYRQETRTGTRTVHNDDGTTSSESYSYTVTVPYNYYILKVKLSNKTLESVIEGLSLTDDQKERYNILLMTYGNKKYLFEDDTYSVSNPGDYPDYRVPGEYLTDEQFGRMMNEAKKYLGRAYVWGGSSPSTGFDCSGFVSWVINHSGNGWNLGRQTAEGLKNSTARVSEADVKPGDLIFFKGTYKTNGASHVGIVVDPVNKIMIHCGNPIQYASYDSSYWRNHFYCYGRIN